LAAWDWRRTDTLMSAAVSGDGDGGGDDGGSIIGVL
jgi:hypothetical protein